jgi:hypothetical protein
MKSKRVRILVAAAVLFVSISRVSAVIEFNDGGVWNIDYEINDNVWIDYQSPGMGTTVNMLDRGSITHYDGLDSFENSITNILGGSISNWFHAHDNSQVSVSGGWMRGLDAHDNSRVSVSGGWINRDFNALGNSHVTVSAGRIRDDFWTRDNSQVTISGGSIDQLQVQDNSHVTVSGGSVARLNASDSSHVTVSGGLFGGELQLSYNAVLTIDGSDFAVDGTDVGYIELSSILGGSSLDESYRRLTGTLLNGDPLDNDFRIGNSATILLVPEPATVLLLGLGGLLGVGIRRSR